MGRPKTKRCPYDTVATSTDGATWEWITPGACWSWHAIPGLNLRMLVETANGRYWAQLAFCRTLAEAVRHSHAWNDGYRCASAPGFPAVVKPASIPPYSPEGGEK